MATTPPPRPRLGGGDISEIALPGIGHRFDLLGVDGGPITVIIHHSGRRDLYIMGGHDEPEATASLSDTQSRTLGAILGGAYFKPAVVEEIEAVVGELLIDWVTLDDRSPGAGKTIAELEIRSVTKMTVAAILRDHVPLVAPEPSEALLPGDRLVVIGRQEDLARFRRHVVGS